VLICFICRCCECDFFDRQPDGSSGAWQAGSLGRVSPLASLAIIDEVRTYSQPA
jgi:hypothetical protein